VFLSFIFLLEEPDISGSFVFKDSLEFLKNQYICKEL